MIKDNVDSFVASLLISYCSFSSLFFSSVVMISFCILFERFFQEIKGLFDARVASINKKEYDFTIHFLQRFIKLISGQVNI